MGSKLNRGMDEVQLKCQTRSIEKEAVLRNQWFRKNEERLNEIANKVPIKRVSDEDKAQSTENQISAFQNVEKHAKVRAYDIVPELEGAFHSVMKPVDPAVTKLIYSGSKNGRINYLKERVKLIPEDRFYFTEVTSFEYGWKFRELMKNIKETRYGRSQILKDTFYRRRGNTRDPEWYREPAVVCPTFSNTAAIC